jgi:hypothetical protein
MSSHILGSPHSFGDIALNVAADILIRSGCAAVLLRLSGHSAIPNPLSRLMF